MSESSVEFFSINPHCGLILKNLWQVHRCLDHATKVLLIKQLIISRLDYCNILYVGLPAKLLDCLQKTLNSCVRFVYGLHGHQEDYSQYLSKLHILPIAERVRYKACMMAYKIVHGQAPVYLSDQVPVEEHQGVSRLTR